MLKLSRSGITTLKRQYKSVLMKCLLINAGILLSASVASAADIVITGGTAYTGANTSATVTDQTINYVTKSEGDTLAAAINTLNGGQSTTGSVANAIAGLTTMIQNGTIKAGEAGSLTGVTASAAELNYVDGVTSNIQDQLDNKQTKLTTSELAAVDSGITAADVAQISTNQSNINKIINGTQVVAEATHAVSANSATTLTGLTASVGELNYVDGVTSNIQDQLDNKQTKLTASELAAVGSGITAADVTQISTNESNIAKIINGTQSVGEATHAASATSANTLAGLTASVGELNYVDGVTSNIQDQLDAKAAASDVTALQSTVGNASSGLVKDVADLKNNTAGYQTASDVSGAINTALGAYTTTAKLQDASTAINASSLKVGDKDVLTTDSTITTAKISDWGTATANFVGKDVSDLTNYTTTAKLQDASTAINASSLKVNNKNVLTEDSSIDVADIDTTSYATSDLKTAVVGTKVDNATSADSATTLTGLNSTVAELNELHGTGVVAADLTKLHGVTATATELNVLDGIEATTAELNKLHGVTASTAQINYLSGVTSDIQTQLDGKTTLATVVEDAQNTTGTHLGSVIKGTKVDAATLADSAKAVTADALSSDGSLVLDSGKLKVGTITSANVSDFDTQVETDISTSISTSGKALNTALAAKQDNLVMGNAALSMASDGKTLSVVADNSTIEVGASGLNVKANSIGAAQLDDVVDHNLLSSTTAGNGLQVVAGNATNNAQINLVLDATTNTDGSGLALTSNGIRVNNVTSSMIANDTITANNIAANAVTASELADDAVDTAAIQNGAVTLAKLNADVSTSTAASGDTKLMTSGGVYSIANVAAAGNYIAAGTNVAGNLSALDTAIGNMSGFASQNYAKSTTSVAANLTALDTQVKKNADDIADTAALVGTPQTAAAGTGILAGYAINGNGTTADKTVIEAVDYVAKNAAGLSINNTYTGTNTFGSTANSQVIIDNGGGLTANTSLKVGTTAANMLSVSSAGTVIGTANAITGTSGALDMGGNSLSNVHGLTLTDGSGHTNDATISVDANGINTGNKTLDVGTGALKSQTLYVGATDQFSVDGSGNIATSGSATVGSLAIGTTGKGFDTTGNLTAGTIAATGIDTTTASKVKLGGSGYTTEVTGDLTVSGASTFGNSTGKYIDITNGALTVHDGTGTSNIKASIGNDGNIMTKGTLDVAGLASLDGGLNVNDVFDVNATTGVVTLTKGTDTATIEMTNIKDSDGNPITNVMKVDGTGLYTGYVASEQGLIVAQYNTSTGRYDEKFVVNANGNIESEGTLSVAGGKFTVDGDGAISAANGAFTVSKDGEIAGMGLTTDATNGVDLGIAGKTTDIIGSAINIGGTGTTTANLLAGTNGVNVSATGTDITGNFSVATNKFTVDSSNGNTTVAGTMDIAGDTKVGSNFTITATDGSMSAAGGKLTVDGNGAISAANGEFTVDKNGNTTVKGQFGAGANGTEFQVGSTGSVYVGINKFTVDGTTGSMTAAAGEFAVDKNGNTTIKGTLGAGANGTEFQVGSTGNVYAQALAFNSDHSKMVNAIDQGAAAITNGTVDTTAQQTMATNATVAKTVGNLAGLYDGTATAASHGITDVDDVADTFASLSTNVEKATGGTFAGTTWTGTMKVAGATNYATTDYNDIMSAVSQVASNIGTATATGYNGVAATNTVNANIDAVNAKIGDWANLHGTYTAGASEGNALTNGGQSDPTTVVVALNNIDATLGTIHGLSAKLEGNGNYYGNLASGTTVEQHLSALDTAIGDRSRFNNMHYTKGAESVVDAIGKLDTGLNDLDHEVRRLRHHFEGGMASAAALSALQPNARATGDTQLAIGTGAYKGHGAMAIGGYHWFTDNLLVNVGVAHDNREATYRMGVTYSW